MVEEDQFQEHQKLVSERILGTSLVSQMVWAFYPLTTLQAARFSMDIWTYEPFVCYKREFLRQPSSLATYNKENPAIENV